MEEDNEENGNEGSFRKGNSGASPAEVVDSH